MCHINRVYNVITCLYNMELLKLPMYYYEGKHDGLTNYLALLCPQYFLWYVVDLYMFSFHQLYIERM